MGRLGGPFAYRCRKEHKSKKHTQKEFHASKPVVDARVAKGVAAGKSFVHGSVHADDADIFKVELA